jgi:endonuclease/exonuclease/phosphatase family metal-dependent hydrolase
MNPLSGSDADAAPAVSSPPALSRPLTVATYNMQKGFGVDLRRDPARTHGVIARLGADIVALQEADRRFFTRRGVLDLGLLREETGLSPVPLHTRSGRDAHGWHGNVILARQAEAREVRLLTLPGAEPRGAVIADLETEEHGPLRIIAVHLGLSSRARAAQAALLAQETARDGRPTILLGDLNEWRLGPFSTLAPLYARFGEPGMGKSFPSPMPLFPLDRIFVSCDTRAFDVSVHDGGQARRASDHLPLVARIAF